MGEKLEGGESPLFFSLGERMSDLRQKQPNQTDCSPQKSRGYNSEAEMISFCALLQI